MEKRMNIDTTNIEQPSSIRRTRSEKFQEYAGFLILCHHLSVLFLRKKSQWAKSRTLKGACIFFVFTNLSITAGVLTVCLASQKQRSMHVVYMNEIFLIDFEVKRDKDSNHGFLLTRLVCLGFNVMKDRERKTRSK